MTQHTTAAIQAAHVLRRIADQQHVDVRFTRSIARAIGDDRMHGRAECAGCGDTPRQGSAFCSERCERIANDLPSPREYAAE